MHRELSLRARESNLAWGPHLRRDCRVGLWPPRNDKGNLLPALVLQVSNLRQHILAKAAHVGDHGVGSVAVETEIDMADAEIAECPQIADDVGRLPRKQPALAVIGTGR